MAITEERSTVLVRGTAAGASNLAAGATTPPIVVRASEGYTGTEPRADMLANHLFVDFKVEVFGKVRFRDLGSASASTRSRVSS